MPDPKAMITEEQAEAALESIRQQFNSYISAGYSPPKIIRDFETSCGVVPYAIVGEEGPFRWTYVCPHGGYDQERSSLMGRFCEIPAAPGWPKDVWAEPINHYSLALYPNGPSSHE